MATQAEDPDGGHAVKRGKTSRGEKLVVVGIGSSAGGLEALRQLLPNLPSSPTLAYVIVQHSDPKHRSMLASLLSSNTTMKVMEFTNGQKIIPETIYITPSGSDVTISNAKLFLRRSGTQIGPKPSIDIFFTSLAQAFGERAVGIILSGTGSDGAHGIRAIKAAGGITLVEEPTSAKYDGMPRAAIETGNVDLVLVPEKIGPELAYILSSPLISHQVQPVEPGADSFTRLVTLINSKTGIDFSEYKPNTLQRRLARRLALHKMSNLNQYLDFVGQHPEELTSLSKDILISVTSFFRDEEAFRILKDVVGKIVEDKQPGESIRVWIPGCATGEEAYSVALLFAQRLGENFDNYNMQIFATDIDGDAIASARRGEYPEASLVNMDPELVSKYFRREDNTFQVIKSLREHIVFARQDLVKDPPFSRLDLITCRNLLIYLNGDLQQRLIPLFHYALKMGGFLFLGKSESIGGQHELFEPISKRWRIFQRKGTLRAQLPQVPKRYRPPQTTTMSQVARKTEISLKDVTNQMVADIFGHPAVLIDERQEVLFVRGNVGAFLRVPEGVAEWNILDLAQDSIRGNLRASIHKATREQSQVTSPRIRLQGDGTSSSLVLHVLPVNHDSAPQGLMLVIFDQTEGHDLVVPEPGQEADWRDMRIAELDQELAATREHLQTITEELETSNEELQSLNEELQSANEELQSSNEELETSNEELQATNEELTTVNEELQVKSSELSVTNSDLENVLRRMSMAMVLVDREHRVKRFTPPATAIFNIMSGDRGQVLTSLPSHVDLPNLRAALGGAIEEGKTVTQTITAGNRTYEMVVYPYYNPQEAISGAILTFYDNTVVLRRQQEFVALVENSPDIVARFDRQLRHLYVNPAVTKATGRAPEWYIGKTNRELGTPPELCDRWERAIQGVFNSGEEAEIRFKFPSPHGEIDIESRLVPEFTPGGAVGTVLSVGRDITRLTCAEQKTQDTANFLGHLLGSINDGFFALDQDLRITYLNSAASQLLREPGEATGKSLLKLLPPEMATGLKERLHQVLGDQKPLEFESHFNTAPFQNWYEVRVYPFAGGITIFLKVINERKKAEEQLREFNREISIQNRLSAIFASAPDDQMYAGVLEVMQEALRSQFGTFGYFQPDGSFVVPATTRGIYWEKCNVPEKNIIFQKGSFTGMWRQALEQRRTIVANDGPFRTPAGHVPIQNSIVTPIYYRDELLSAIHLANKPGGYDEKDRLLLESIAAHIAPVLQARLVQRAEEEERLRAELALRQSEGTLRLFIEIAPVALAMFDHQMRYMAASQNWLRDYGLVGREILGQSHYDLFPDLPERWKVAHARGLAGEVVEVKEDTYTRPDGSLRWYQWAVHPWHLADGAVGGIVVLTVDITERKLAEEKTESLARFPQENPNPVLRVGSDKTLLYYNRPGELLLGLLGYQPGQSSTLPEPLWKVMAKVKASGQLEISEGHYGQHYFSLTVVPVAGQDYVNVYATDITSRKQAEDERNLLETQLRHAQKMESLGTLAGGIAHEFNNLLAAIMGYTQLIQDITQDRADLQADLAQIMRAGERGRDLVRQILTFSRKTEPVMRPLNINAEVIQDLEMLKRLLPKMVEIKTQLASDIKIVRIAPNHINQVLTNLVSNAAHAMPEGGKLTIKTANLTSAEHICPICGEVMADDYVVLSVSDTGHGMEPKTLERIFEPFFSTKAVGAGTGLGLSVVHGLVRSYEGHIHATSQLGVGTTLEVFLPARADNDAATSQIDQSNAELPGGREAILLVDDEEPLRQMGNRLLTSAGYRVLTASSGEEALEIYGVQGAKLDLVLLDIGMPGMGGIRCLQGIRNINPQAKVIITSGYISDDQVRSSTNAGAAAYLDKPFRRAILLTKVREILDGQSS